MAAGEHERTDPADLDTRRQMGRACDLPMDGRGEAAGSHAARLSAPAILPALEDRRANVCQRSPYSEPPGSGKLSHPGSPNLSPPRRDPSA
jgi:hypothetical protein